MLTRKYVGALVLLTALATAQEPLAEPNLLPEQLVNNERTCFDNEQKSWESLREFVLKDGKTVSEEQLSQIRDRYEHRRTHFQCRWFEYQVDGLTVTGFLAKPTQHQGKLPVVIYNHGGNADIGAIRSRYIMGKLFPLVEKGFVIIGSQYRGASRWGEPPHPDRLKDEFGGKDVNDILALLPIIDALPHADSQRIGVWGSSRGGMMAYLAARQSARFAALVAESTPTDLVSESKFRPMMNKVFETWIPGYREDPESVLRARSALYWADALPETMPILILHGAADAQVSPNSALAMASRLTELNRQYKLVVFDKTGHSLAEQEPEANREISQWFTRYLAVPSAN